MAYVMNWDVRVSWVGDGVGQMQALGPGSPSLKITNSTTSGATSAGGTVVIPGGDSPTGANLTTAATTVGTNIGTILNASAILTQIQGWSTGTTS